MAKYAEAAIATISVVMSAENLKFSVQAMTDHKSFSTAQHTSHVEHVGVG